MVAHVRRSDLVDLAATTHRFESRYLDRLVGPLPADARPATATGRRSRTRRRSAPRARRCTETRTRRCRSRRRQRLIAAVRAAGGTVERHVYEGEGHGWCAARDGRRRLRPRRRVPAPLGARPVNATGGRRTSRGPGAARTGRCSSRTGPAPTCTRPRLVGGRRRAGRRGDPVAAVRLPVPGGGPAGPRPPGGARRGDREPRRRPWPGARSCRPSGWCSAAARWAAASARWWRPTPRTRSRPRAARCSATRCTRRAGPNAPRRALPGAHDAGAVRERHPRRVRHPGRADAPHAEVTAR